MSSHQVFHYYNDFFRLIGNLQKNPFFWELEGWKFTRYKKKRWLKKTLQRKKGREKIQQIQFGVLFLQF